VEAVKKYVSALVLVLVLVLVLAVLHRCMLSIVFVVISDFPCCLLLASVRLMSEVGVTMFVLLDSRGVVSDIGLVLNVSEFIFGGGVSLCWISHSFRFFCTEADKSRDGATWLCVT